MTGDAVNTAARLQAFAPLAGVVTGQATYAATARLFLWEALPPVALKGKADSVAIWRLLPPVARLESPGAALVVTTVAG